MAATSGGAKATAGGTKHRSEGASPRAPGPRTGTTHPGHRFPFFSPPWARGFEMVEDTKEGEDMQERHRGAMTAMVRDTVKEFGNLFRRGHRPSRHHARARRFVRTMERLLEDRAVGYQ